MSDDCDDNSPLPFRFDVLYGIKTEGELHAELEYLTSRLAGLAKLCRDDGNPIDSYILTVLDLRKRRRK